MLEIILSDDNFEEEVIKAKETVLVDFWAPWCGPCRMQAPIFEELAKEMPEIKFGKLNIDENPATVARFGIMSVPTLIVFQNQKMTDQMVGIQTKDQLKKKLKTLVG